MSKAANAPTTISRLGGWRGFVRNPGLFLHTWRAGHFVGSDADGNNFYESAVKNRRPRRWVVYAGVAEASAIGPEWDGWLRYMVDAPLPLAARRAWQLPHQANLTGTAVGYRPAGHDYKGGRRAANSADYEAWTPDA